MSKKQYEINVPVEYVIGHYKEGHLQTTIEADNEEEALAIAKSRDEESFELIVDEEDLEDIGPLEWNKATIQQLGEE